MEAPAIGVWKSLQAREKILVFPVAHGLIMANTNSKKKKKHLITFNSEKTKSQVVFWALRRNDWKYVLDREVMRELNHLTQDSASQIVHISWTSAVSKCSDQRKRTYHKSLRNCKDCLLILRKYYDGELRSRFAILPFHWWKWSVRFSFKIRVRHDKTMC